MKTQTFALNALLAKLYCFILNGAYAYNPLEYAAAITEAEMATLKSARISIMNHGSLITAAELAERIRRAL